MACRRREGFGAADPFVTSGPTREPSESYVFVGRKSMIEPRLTTLQLVTANFCAAASRPACKDLSAGSDPAPIPMRAEGGGREHPSMHPSLKISRTRLSCSSIPVRFLDDGLGCRIRGFRLERGHQNLMGWMVGRQ
ncbi:uncharacterized protein LOC112890177 isoform X1 [Panicum hallii]|uniref:uncharacterized protein LOC112890177 isoform X1 n=1 Tax=Panicum hallii TaxID=206008 RepID=UPI000DF4E27F|nr:uncharacterized protein LOC112890177 isoform X1 [Panicum hallii]